MRRMAAKLQRAIFKTILDLGFGGGSSASLGTPYGSPDAGTIVLCGVTRGGAETGGGGGGGGGTTDGGGGACGTTISFWHDGQLIWFPE